MTLEAELTEISMTAHKIADIAVAVVTGAQPAVGRASIYNAVRQAAIEVLADRQQQRSRCVCAPYHVTWCPSYGEDNRAAVAAASEKEGNDDAR